MPVLPSKSAKIQCKMPSDAINPRIVYGEWVVPYNVKKCLKIISKEMISYEWPKTFVLTLPHNAICVNTAFSAIF